MERKHQGKKRPLPEPIEHIDLDELRKDVAAIEDLLVRSRARKENVVYELGGRGWVGRELDAVRHAIETLEGSRPVKPEIAEKIKLVYRLFLGVRLKLVSLLDTVPKNKKRKRRELDDYLTSMTSMRSGKIFPRLPGDWALHPKQGR